MEYILQFISSIHNYFGGSFYLSGIITPLHGAIRAYSRTGGGIGLQIGQHSPSGVTNSLSMQRGSGHLTLEQSGTSWQEACYSFILYYIPLSAWTCFGQDTISYVLRCTHPIIFFCGVCISGVYAHCRHMSIIIS